MGTVESEGRGGERPHYGGIWLGARTVTRTHARHKGRRKRGEKIETRMEEREGEVEFSQIIAVP